MLIDENIPQELLDLYIPAKNASSIDKTKSKLFLNNILAINNLFAMTSFKASNHVNDWSTFQVEGKVLHHLNNIIPEDINNASFAQIYFLNDGDQLKYRLQKLINILNNPETKNEKTYRNKIKELSKHYKLYGEIIKTIQSCLYKHNAFIHEFKQAANLLQTKKHNNLKIVFNAKHQQPGSSKKIYDAPVVREVASIFPETDSTEWHSRCIIVYLKDTAQRRKDMKTKRSSNEVAFQIINEFNAHYDPLHYVLLFPTGQLSWGFYQPRKIQPHPKKTYFPPFYTKTWKMHSEEDLRDICKIEDLCPYVRNKHLIKQLQELTTWKIKVKFFL